MVEPCDRALDDPAFGEHNEFADIGPLDDFHVDLAADPLQPLLELRPLIAAIA